MPREEPACPDFDGLRAEIPTQQVLQLLGSEPERRRAGQWYSRCPLLRVGSLAEHPSGAT